MKKFSLVLVTILLLLVFVVPVAAANPRVKTGDRISILDGPTSYPAGKSFHIEHGWGFHPPDEMPEFSPYSFRLELDGVKVPTSFILRTVDMQGDVPISWLWVYNFPEGLTGVHTFTGRWCNRLGCQTRELTVTFQ